MKDSLNRCTSIIPHLPHENHHKQNCLSEPKLTLKFCSKTRMLNYSSLPWQRREKVSSALSLSLLQILC